MPEVAIQVSLKVVYGQLVSILETPIVLRILLNGVVCQMNKLVWKVLYRELLWACPEVAVSVEEPLLKSIYRGHHSIASNVKLSAINEKWLFNVLLNDQSARGLSGELWSEDRLYLIQGVRDLNPTSSIGIFPGLNDPYVFAVFLTFQLCECVKELLVVTITAWSGPDVKCKGDSHLEWIQA